MLFLLECSDESFKPDTEDQDEENVNLQTSSELKQEMDTDESDSSGQVKKQLFPHHLSGNLIRAIKDRPDLYKRSSNSSKIHKHNLWKEVCSEVNPSWAQMPKKRKMEYCKYRFYFVLWLTFIYLLVTLPMLNKIYIMSVV